MEKKSRSTIQTIAKMAGVSTYTVSHALGGFSDVSEATAARIKQIAEAIGYTPNASARSLSTRKTNIIGMIVPAIGPDTTYNEVITAVTKAAASKGLCVQLGSCDRDFALEKAYCKMMCESRVQALIMVPISSDVSQIKAICEGLVPLIFMGGKTGLEETYSITIDYTRSADLAVSHLYELGHRKIALFLYHPDNQTIAMKHEGYLRAMADRGMEPFVYWEGASSDTYTAGYVLTERLIAQDKLPTAIWCASDLMALGVVEALKGHGLKVPQDLSVMGHDNLFFTGTPSLSLTTFTLPKAAMGQHAIQLALSIMGRCDEPVESKRVFTAELVKRGSTSIPPRQPGS